MTAFLSPVTWAQIKADLGMAASLANGIRLELAEQLDVLSPGSYLSGRLVVVEGQIAHSDSDVIRIRYMGGLGKQAQMVAVGETGAVAPSGWTGSYVDLTLGSYAVAREMSYLQNIVVKSPEASWQAIVSATPDTIARQIRLMYCQVGELFAVDAGTPGAAFDLDHYLALAAIYTSNPESFSLGRPVLTHASKLFSDLQTDLRTEAAIIYGGPTTLAEINGVSQQQIKPNFLQLGIDLACTGDVQDDATDYISFIHQPGAVVASLLDTSTMVTGNPQGTVKLPAVGSIIEELTDGSRQTTLGFRATLWAAMGEIPAAIAGPRRTVKSVM